MKRLICILMGLIAISGSSRAENCPDQHSISGSVLKIILIALPEFERQSIDIETYTISVGEDKELYYVEAFDPTKPKGYRGSQPGRPELTVEISKAEHKIIRFHLNR